MEGLYGAPGEDGGAEEVDSSWAEEPLGRRFFRSQGRVVVVEGVFEASLMFDMIGWSPMNGLRSGRRYESIQDMPPIMKPITRVKASIRMST